MDRIAIYIIGLSSGKTGDGNSESQLLVLALVARRDGGPCIFLLSPVSNPPASND
jgi:hypothetical protein